MAKYTSADIRKIAERLKSARDNSRPAHFLLGAGCSISAGIPSATRLVEQIHSEYPAHCADLKDEDRRSYGACMALLSPNERRDLIKAHLEKAKINWGTIALAQLIAKGFVGRILTANFDLVLENACGLLGLQPAVYDFGIAPANDPAMIVSPSIIHLHGQSYGLVRLNTDEETRSHREKLQPILKDSLRNAPLVVVGYSGSADGIFKTLLEEFKSLDRLYWASYDEEPESHIRPFLEKEHFHFIGGADFDRFMIELVQSLGCWPPHLFSNPLAHLLGALSPVVSYPVMDSESAIDLLDDLRKKIESWQQKLTEEEDQSDVLQRLYMKGEFQAVTKLFSGRPDRKNISTKERNIAALSLVGLGNELTARAIQATGKTATTLFTEAAEQYHAAFEIEPDRYEVLYNWGRLLVEQAKRAKGAEAARLFADAGEKYQRALAVKPDSHETLNSWGIALVGQAKVAGASDATRLFAEASKRYDAALKIKPDKHSALNNWGNLLAEQAKRVDVAAATRLFDDACEKYRAALKIKPDYRDALDNWGSLLFEQAMRSHGDEAARLLREADEKLGAAVKIDPTNTYNTACLAALQGNESKCRKNLENTEKNGMLPNVEHLMADSDLNAVRDKSWFKKLLARQKKAAAKP
ncbi:MAG TPA: SIR2 family protein [Bradyrhizobium sp.]|jgi:Tfp pilus assembly protein PilF|nr:SIR2 family protein [Bradyrhizobium sp.]